MMKTLAKYFRFAAMLFALLMPALACSLSGVTGSGRVTSEARTVSGFDAVSLSGSGELVITQGETEGLTIEAEDNILPHIKTEVKNGELIIAFDREDGGSFYRPTQPIQFNLALKDLRTLDLSGSGSVYATALKADRLTVNVSGSGSVKFDQLQANDLNYDLSGSGQAELSGQVTSQQVNIGGSGDYRAGDLESQTAVVKMSGSASVTLWAQESLDVHMSGSGSVSYYGSPKITSDTSGSGSLNSLGDK